MPPRLRRALREIAGLLLAMAIVGCVAGLAFAAPPRVLSGAWRDGSVGATVGTIAHPHLLDLSSGTNEAGVTLTLRPAWAVPDVDYPVGTSSGQTYKTFGVDTLPTCVYLSGNLVRTQGGCGNIVIDGWDFTTGYTLYMDGNFTNNLEVRNSKFALINNTNAPLVQSQAANQYLGDVWFHHNTFDGANFIGGNADYEIMCPSSGSILIEYNRFINSGGDAIDCGGYYDYPRGATIRYNSFVSIGTGGANVHGDAVQSWAGPGSANNPATPGLADINHFHVYGNLFYQPVAVAGVPTAANSFVRIGDLGTRVAWGPEIDHNVAVCIGNTGHNDPGSGGLTDSPACLQFAQLTGNNPPAGSIQRPYVANNYVFTSGGGSYNTGTLQGFQNGPFYPTSGAFVFNGTWANNINMRDGSSLTTTP